MYIKKGIEYSIIESNITFSEHIIVKIKLLNTNYLHFCVIYRSPNSSKENNNLMFDIFKFLLNTTNENVMFIGDFNFPGIDWNDWVSKYNNKYELEFINMLQEKFLLQHVNFPTRARGTHDPHTLDLVISNDDFISGIENLSPLGKSDHSVLRILSSLNKFNAVNEDKLNFKKGDYEGLRKSLNIDWVSLLDPHSDDIEEMWNAFKNIININCFKYIPVTNNFDSWKKKDWKCPISKEIRIEIKQKSRLWTRYIETKDETILNKYKHIRNTIRNKTRNIIKEEQLEIAKSCKNNPKKFWNYVKSKTKNQSCIGDIKFKNENDEVSVAKTDEDKADAFCNYFSSVFTRENKDVIENLNLNVQDTFMSDIVFDVENIKTKLKNLNVNKSSGPDNIHSKILNESSEILALPLKIIFESSFKLKQLPSDWKSANISAIFKKGSKLEVNNYRPVSLTCICCKIMESVIRDEIFKFFIENKLFSNLQFGFIKGRSTVLQLLKVLDEWTKFLELGGQVDVIYTDFEKAFDKVPHRRLINKLKSYKINKNIIDWIEAFLTTRKQRVKINGVFSQWQKVISGVPQGTILGPLLFIIYINDLINNCSKGSKLYLYADDAKIFKHIVKDEDVVILQEDVHEVKEWADINLLKLNIIKCKVLSYGKSANINSDYYIKCDDVLHKLEKLDSITDLGVVFDNQLKFDLHINEKVKKAYSILGIINRNFKFLTTSTFILLYKSMVRSHLEYANCVWSPSRKIDIDNLEKVQKRATKMISCLKNMNYEDRLKKLNLPTLKYRRLRGDMIETYKIVTEKYDHNSVVQFKRNENSCTRGNNFKLFQSSVNTNLRKYFFTNRIVNVWNSLPNNVVTAKNTNTFKNLLDKHWINQEFKFNYKVDISGTGSRSLKE